jgi:hypothetical protein
MSDYSSVNLPCAAYGTMLGEWQMIDDLLGGTQQMRSAGPKWLPQMPAENLIAYNNRLNNTFLYNAIGRAIRTLVSKPFSEEIQIAKEVVGEQLDYMKDIDRLGNDITSFARQAAMVGLAKGLVHFLTDYPTVLGPITLAEKALMEIRPYVTLIDPENLIGWRYVMERGVPVLSQARIREYYRAPAGSFGEMDVRQVRVFERVVIDGLALVGFTVFRQRRDPNSGELMNEWDIVDSGQLTIDKIPITTAYFGEKTGFFTARPPLIDMAWLNVEHWQSSSDQRHILHVARVPVWFLSGWQPDLDDNGNPKNKIEIGPDRMIRVTQPEAKLVVVEHAGHGIGAGRQDLMDIEARMAMLSTEILSKKTKGETSATEEAHDNKAEDSDLGAMIRDLEKALTGSVQFMYEFEKLKAPQGKLVTINTDFGLTPQDAADLQSLYQARMAGQITHATFLKELVRRGVLAPSTDLTAEETSAKKEGPVVMPTGGDATQGTMTQKAGPGA